MSRQAQEAIARLRDLWRAERDAAKARAFADREAIPLRERVARGMALKDLAIDDEDAAPGDRTLLWLVTRDKPEAIHNARLGPGDPVRLWWDDPHGEDVVLATVARVRKDRLGVMVSGTPPERLDDGGFRLDRDHPEVTFRRGRDALRRAEEASASSDLGRLREVIFGDRAPEWEAPEPWTPLDPDLNPPQREAVTLALGALDIALVHGPPGTGKTRTLVELIRQCAQRGERVLAAAESNTAVDNLAERLADAGVPVVRVGHPARVCAAVQDRTLDALAERDDGARLARAWIAEARSIRDKAFRRYRRGALDRRELKAMLRDARDLQRDARRQLGDVQRAILRRAPVVCATAAGADTHLLDHLDFERVVLDEATQATDPIALVALSRAPRAVLAGDPHQLPPTVIARDAQDLASTLFERLVARHDDRVCRMLTVQHRMHADLMAFPSESKYGGRLTAAAHVAAHTLDDLGVAPDPLRPGPLTFIDTAGKGWEDRRTDDDPSSHNPDQAARTAAEVRRLIGRGLPPADLAVITPYDAQARLLRDLLAPEVAAGLEIDSVDGFQGREREAIVLDLVRSNPDGHLGFLSDTRRMNVALTRARRALLIVGDSATLGGHPYYADLFVAVEALGHWVSAWNDDAPLWEG